MSRRRRGVPKEIREAFEAYDDNGDGKISKKELGDVLRDLDSDTWTREAVNEFWETSCLSADEDGDGKLNLKEFLQWVYSGGQEEMENSCGDDSDDDEDAPFQVLRISRTDKVKVLEFDKKKKARKRFQKLKKKGGTAVMVKNETIRPGKVCGSLFQCIFLIGMAFGKGYSDMGPCAEEGSEYCVFPDADDDSGDEDEDEDEEDEEDDDGWTLVFTRRDGEGIKTKSYPRKRKAMKQFRRKAGRGLTILLIKNGGIKKFRGDGDDDAGDFDDTVHKELAFLVGAAYGKGLIEDWGPFEDGGNYPILGEDFEEDDDASSDEDSDDEDESAFQVLKMSRADKVKVLEFNNKKKATKRFRRFKKKDRTAVMVKDLTIRPGKVCGSLFRCIFLIGMAFGMGYSDMGPCAVEGNKYCVFPDAEDDSGDEGEDEDDEDEDDGDGWTLVFTRRDGEGIKTKSYPRKRKAMKQFRHKAGRGLTILLIKGSGIKKFRGDGDDDAGDFDDTVHKELAFLVGAAYGKGLITDWGPFEDGGAYPILGEDFEDDDDDDCDSD